MWNGVKLFKEFIMSASYIGMGDRWNIVRGVSWYAHEWKLWSILAKILEKKLWFHFLIFVTMEISSQ